MARILYIEPDRLLASTYTQALARSGHQVTYFSDAAPAMQAADRLTPELLVMELQLAGHNGVDFLYEWRSYSEWQDIPILILSVIPPYEVALSTEFWQLLGIQAYLYKPHTSLAQLGEAVSLALAAYVRA